jgi:hypothetical protein
VDRAAVLAPAERETRTAAAVAWAGLTAWLLYTRFFPGLQAAHATLPPCPFLAVTGHPCPFCGGTRAFSAMWQGDPGRAVQLYPLAPALFVGAFAAAVLAAGVALSGRFMRLPLGAVMPAALLLLALNWLAKLFWLGT